MSKLYNAVNNVSCNLEFLPLVGRVPVSIGDIIDVGQSIGTEFLHVSMYIMLSGLEHLSSATVF
jgi:hypothetical protein